MSSLLSPITFTLQKAVGVTMVLKNLILPLFIALNAQPKDQAYIFNPQFWAELYEFGFLGNKYFEFLAVPSLL